MTNANSVLLLNSEKNRVGQVLFPPPLVSVVMPVLNPHPVYFPLAVQSILDQTLEQFELIIVEDPSPRNAQSYLDSLDDPRIRYYRNAERTGLIRQRNQGLFQARASLIATFDADDVAAPDRLRHQYDYFQAHPEIDVLGTQIAVIDGTGAIQGHRRFPLTHDDIMEALPRCVPLSHPSVMYRKEAVLDAGGYQHEEYPHVDDYELWSRLALGGRRFANLPEALVRYRIHAEMGKATRLREVIRGVLRVKRVYWRDRMDFRARLRAWGEMLLLGVPTWLTFHLLVQWLYRDSSPVKPNSSTISGPASQR
jgi:glycosyltransferase involved in cell wall biosynthesis